MDVKGKVLLQLFYKRKLKNGTKTFLEPKFFLFIVKFTKLGFSAPLIIQFSNKRGGEGGLQIEILPYLALFVMLNCIIFIIFCIFPHHIFTFQNIFVLFLPLCYF